VFWTIKKSRLFRPLKNVLYFITKGNHTVNSLEDIWKLVLEILGEKLTPVAISTWFKDCQAVDLVDNRLILYVPSNFKKGIIEESFIDAIKDALHQIFVNDYEVTILGENTLEKYKKDSENKIDSRIDSEEYTFERFVVGNSNKFAHAAAKAVAGGQKKDYNPLFIYGESGLGKTHLLYAIRHEVKHLHPDYQIVYVKGDDFTNDLITAIQTGKNVEFRDKYRYADLFLMDDIQFIAGKPSTQEEFFNTFNTLYEANHQIVFTSDRPPQEMMRLADRLKTRFESGLVTEILPPDYETRMAIIRNKANQLGLELPEDVADFIAENFTSNVRQIEGAVKKIVAYRDMMGGDINVKSVSTIIHDLFKDPSEFTPTPDIIIEECAKYYSLTSEDLKGQSRSRNTVLARQIAMFLIRRLTRYTLQDIGMVFENRDHATVISSLRKIEEILAKNQEFNQIIKDITTNINAHA